MTMPRRLLITAFPAGMLCCLLQVCPAQEHPFNGKPQFREGGDRCYYVWRDGNNWHVRWTSYGRLLHFAGMVQAEQGKLEKMKRIDVESERRVIRPRGAVIVRDPLGRPRVAGRRSARVVTREQDRIERDGDRRIVFSSQTNDDVDGFDFRVTDDVRVLRFRLEIEGQLKTEEIEVGKRNTRPSQNPFQVKL